LIKSLTPAGFSASEFRIRKHGFAPNSTAIGGKLISAEKRDVFYRIKAFFCRNALCISKKNNAETGKNGLFAGYVFL